MPFLEFALKALELKDLKRTGWIVRKVSEPESVASHSFFLAVLAMLYSEKEGLNEKKCIELALCHDLHESICGDICSREFEHEQEMTNAQKQEIEKNAIQEFTKLIPEENKEKIQGLSLNYLEQSSKEALFVRDLDLIEMCLQALYYKEYNRTQQNLSDFFRKSEKEISTKTGKELFTKIKKRFEET